MFLDEIREYCLAKPAVSESLPFGPETLVFKVAEKLFLLTNIEQPDNISLKCDPERAVELREKYSEIISGYHLNKKHWNTVNLKGSLKPNFIKGLIDHSYDLVFASLPKKLQEEIKAL